MGARFHLAFPVHDLDVARAFYGELLGCPEGRADERWVDFDFWGNQITAHLSEDAAAPTTNEVDGDQVPARHFGAILPWEEWEAVRDRLLARDVTFRIHPRIRFRGEVGEQATMFFDDPSGNVIELKAFRDEASIFARDVS
jgi:extradiol dioxygenase family protein